MIVKRHESLDKQIVETFANVNYPVNDQITPCICDECKVIKEKVSNLSNKSWNNIGEDFIEENYDCLPLLAPEAFHFLLPAFLIYSLKHFDLGFKVSSFTLSTLCPGKDWEENRNWWEHRFQKFSTPQLDLIFDFLNLAFEDEGFENDHVSIERGKKRLEIILRSKH